MKGVVKWFDNDKGYGFIEYRGKELYVHYTAINTKGYKTLVKDEIVTFEIAQTKFGLRAKNVLPIKTIR